MSRGAAKLRRQARATWPGNRTISRVAQQDTRAHPTAHISRVQVDDEQGHEIEILRHSVPYGTVRERDLYFVAFSAERVRYDVLLARMFGTSGDALSDRPTEFSRPACGACYFAPSLNAFSEVGGPE